MQNELYYLFLTILSGVVTIFFVYLTKFINMVFEKVENEIIRNKDDNKRKLFLNALNDLEKIVNVSVLSTEQVIGKKLKNSIKLGDASKNDLKELSEFAYNKIDNTLSENNKQILKQQIINLESYIHDLIETEVLKLKEK